MTRERERDREREREESWSRENKEGVEWREASVWRRGWGAGGGRPNDVRWEVAAVERHAARHCSRWRRPLVAPLAMIMLLLLLLPLRLLLGVHVLLVLLHVATASAGDRDGDRYVVLHREPVEGGVRERRRHHDHHPRGHQWPCHRAPHDLSLRPRQRYREPAGRGGAQRLHRRGQERGRDGQDLEPPSKHDRGRSPRRQRRPSEVRLAERDVRDGAGARENADSEVPAAGEPREGVDHVVPRGDLQHVRPHRRRGLRFPGDHHRQLRLILGPRRPPPRSLDHLDCRSISPCLLLLLIELWLLALPAAPAAVDFIRQALLLLRLPLLLLLLLLLKIMVLEELVLHVAGEKPKNIKQFKETVAEDFRGPLFLCRTVYGWRRKRRKWL
ncbi:unnamed protein product [Musa acuminata subsp. burmannicoides]